MKNFKLDLYDKAYVDASDYYPLKILPMGINPELLNLINIFNKAVFNDSEGLYYGTSKKPLVYFPFEIILRNNKILIIENLEEFKFTVLEHSKDIKQISSFNIDRAFIYSHLDSLSEHTCYPYFLDLFCYSLELEYNTGVLLSDYLIKSPFQQSTYLCLYHPDELQYANIDNLLKSKDLENLIPNYEHFVRIANKIITDYCSKISEYMNDPYRTIKVNFLTGISTTLNIELIPSIMERWGLIAKHMNK